MTNRRSVSARAYTSIANLGYGFDVFGLCVDAGFDVVSIGPSADGIGIGIDGPHAEGIPADVRANTAGLAVEAMMTHFNVTEGAAIRITKGIRCGSGMGSSAASAAAAVAAANAFFGFGCSREQLVRFAAEGERASAGTAHADNVAASIFGGLTICTGGERANVVSVTPPSDLRVVIALPEIKVSTSVARAAMPERVSLSDYSMGCGRCAMVVAALGRGDIAAFGRAVEGSFVDRCRGGLIPGFSDVGDRAKSAGAAGVTIGGAGPAVAAIVPREGDARAIAEAMEAGFREVGLRSDMHIAGVAEGATVLEHAG